MEKETKKRTTSSTRSDSAKSSASKAGSAKSGTTKSGAVKSSTQQSAAPKKKRKRSAKKVRTRRRLMIFFGILLAIVLVLIGVVYAVFNHYYGKSNFTEDDDIIFREDADTDDIELESGEADVLQSQVAEELESIETQENTDVYNILLIGVDRRDSSWYGNSDSMILLSINRTTKKITMTSFMRDLYADIPGVGVKKLNAACAYGGGPLLVQTIEQNYKIDIDNYASVDFSAMIDIVNIMGGVQIEISAAEAEVGNDYVREMCELRGVDPSAHYFSGGGVYNMDGYQAVAYARIRYVGNADYERTERQREVLNKIIEKATSLSIGELNEIANAVLPLVTHNVESGTVLSLMTELPSFLSYERSTSRVPYDGMFSSQGGLLVPDFAATIQKLQTDIYGSSTLD